MDGKLVRDPAFDVSDQNKVVFDGADVRSQDERSLKYILLHKPVGVISSLSTDKEEGLCLSDLVQVDYRIYPVGRLDKDTSGLLLLTNDGDLTQRLAHPSQKVQKEYHLKINRMLNRKDYYAIKRGIEVDGRIVEVDQLSSVKGGRLSITIHEGRNRIVRRLFKEVGYRVIELKRVRIGNVTLGKLAVGKWRYLREAEIVSITSTTKTQRH